MQKAGFHRLSLTAYTGFKTSPYTEGALFYGEKPAAAQAVMPPAIVGIGTTGGFEFWIQDKGSGDPIRLDDVTRQFIAKASQRPELVSLNTTFRATSQQLRAEVDRSKTVLLNVPVDDVYSALQAQFGSIQVSQFNQYSRVWNVVLQSDAPFRKTPSDITQLYTRSNSGQMVPLSTLVTVSVTSSLIFSREFSATTIVPSSR